MQSYLTSVYWWATIIVVAAYALTVIACIIVVLRENRNPIRSLAWVIALIFLPVGGLVFYLFFGRSLKNMRMISRHKKRRLMRPGNFSAIISTRFWLEARITSI